MDKSTLFDQFYILLSALQKQNYMDVNNMPLLGLLLNDFS